MMIISKTSSIVMFGHPLSIEKGANAAQKPSPVKDIYGRAAPVCTNESDAANLIDLHEGHE
jgi:hypothetical protein